MFDKNICNFLVEIQKLRYIPEVDEIQRNFELGIVNAYKKIYRDTFEV